MEQVCMMTQEQVNGYEAGIKNDLIGLKLISEYKFLRAKEIGRFLWGKSAHATKYGERIARKWIDKKMVLARPLPGRAGTALVLASRGVDFLSEYNVDSQSGKDWGSINDSKWMPPKEWQHHCLANSLLSFLACDPAYSQLIPENILRRSIRSGKTPDALVTFKDKYRIWIEVENHRKTGSSMTDLISAMLSINSVSNRTFKNISGIDIHYFVVAHPINKKDENGHVIDHKTRIISAAKKQAIEDFRFIEFAFEMDSDSSVKEAKMTMSVIESDTVSVELARLEKHSMEFVDDTPTYYLDDGTVIQLVGASTWCLGVESQHKNITTAKRWIATQNVTPRKPG